MAWPRSLDAADRRRQSRLVRGCVWLVILSFILALSGRVGKADESGKTITIGETNSPQQREQLLTYFGAEEDDRVIIVSVADTSRAMSGIFDMSYITTAYSSTALTCRELGDGLDVTTRNITRVTPGLYAMALVTAGIGDATLIVAAPDGMVGVEGMTALAGVFQTWDLAPCASGNTSPERQRLALEELTLTAEIGGLLGLANGVQVATNLVLEVQKTIVTEGLRRESDIDAVIAGQERIYGLAIPAEQRARLLDLMVRLVRTDIDWGTFAAGWTIDTNADNTRITMRGEGIAIRNAQATATARAGAALTATAEAEAALTATAGAAATAEAGLTATAAAATATAAAATATAAAAQATADARATEDAIAALTATAAAQPTATPIPPPTPTPEPFAVSGRVLAVEDEAVRIADQTGAELVYPIGAEATVTRDGQPASFTDLEEGDTIDLTIDGVTNAVRQAHAEARPIGLFSRLIGLSWLLPIGLVGPAAWAYWRRRGSEPFVVREIASPR